MRGSVLVTNTGPSGIAAAPDGTVWFTQESAGNTARITSAGVITEAKTVKGSRPFGITVAHNGDPWYTMMAANKIATLQRREAGRSSWTARRRWCPLLNCCGRHGPTPRCAPSTTGLEHGQGRRPDEQGGLDDRTDHDDVR